MTQTSHWPKLKGQPLHVIELPYKDTHLERDNAIGRFIHQPNDHCLWLSSCWPHFKEDADRDIIAGGFSHWLIAPSDKPDTHLLQTIENGQPQTLHETQGLPQAWMLEQLYRDLPKDNANKDTHRIALPGWYGGLSYPYADHLTGLKTPTQRSTWPDAMLGYASWVITLDHLNKTATLVTNNKDTHLNSNLNKAWVSSLENQAHLPTIDLKPWESLTSEKEYMQSFHCIQDHLNAGDTYQVNFTQCFEAPYTGHPLSVFLQLKQQSPSPYAAYWYTPYGEVSSQSPELLLKIQDKNQQGQPSYNAITKPIKGTTPRGATPEEDQQAAEELAASDKNRAENSMIVDLLRNDLSKSAIPGSMTVNKLCAIESFAHIHHLVSEIQVDVQQERSPMQVLLDCFPGGSITGAPKRRAMEIIDNLEKTPRDSYCGTIGFWDHPQRAVFNITIRTFQFEKDTVKIWAGGGIVTASTAISEYEECFHKVQRLMSGVNKKD